MVLDFIFNTQNLHFEADAGAIITSDVKVDFWNLNNSKDSPDRIALRACIKVLGKVICRFLKIGK